MKPKKCTECGEPMKAHQIKMVPSGMTRRGGEPVMSPQWKCPDASKA
jgi:hypothetical protein